MFNIEVHKWDSAKQAFEKAFLLIDGLKEIKPRDDGGSELVFERFEGREDLVRVRESADLVAGLMRRQFNLNSQMRDGGGDLELRRSSRGTARGRSRERDFELGG